MEHPLGILRSFRRYTSSPAGIDGRLSRPSPSTPKQSRPLLISGVIALLAATVIAGCATRNGDGKAAKRFPGGTSATASPEAGTGPSGSTAFSLPKPSGGVPTGVPEAAQPGYVAKHVDGDTFWVEIRDPGPLPAAAVHKIRILEIDTPESTSRKDCFGREAAEFAERELPLGSRVYLLADKEDKDRYGRYLRYVWNRNGEFYNEKVIRQGLARAVLYPPNDLYIARLRAAEAEAQLSARGLWDACAGRR